MFKRLVEWVKRLLGIQPQPVREPIDDFTADYQDVTRENLTAVIAGKLSNLTLGESTVEISGDGARAALVRGVSERLWAQLPRVVAQTWGKGGTVLVPLVNAGQITVSAIDQTRVTVNRREGGRITAATVLAETAVAHDRPYYRMLDYSLDEYGTQRIAQRAVNDTGAVVPLDVIAAWAGLTEETTISGTDRLLLGWIRCPRDNRGDESDYGVPITYGAGRELAETAEHLAWYRREFKLARPMLGLDAALWHNMNDMSIQDVRRTVQDDDTPFVPVQYSAIEDVRQWQHFAPDIRQAAFEGRLQSLYRRLERACGLSQGILTERQQMNYANKDEVRSAMYDTYSAVSLMRASVEQALNDVCYAADVLAERFGLTPAGARGQWELRVDWDMSLVESTQQTFAQLSELRSEGLITGARLVQWVLGGTEADAIAEVEAARAEQPPPVSFGGIDL